MPEPGPSCNEGAITCEVLSVLNTSYESVFNHSFTDSVLKYCGKKEGITKKDTAVEKKQKKRIMQRNICSAIEKRYNENLGVNVLCENESFQAYQRKRLSLSFDHKDTPAKESAM